MCNRPVLLESFRPCVLASHLACINSRDDKVSKGICLVDPVHIVLNRIDWEAFLHLSLCD